MPRFRYRSRPSTTRCTNSSPRGCCARSSSNPGRSYFDTNVADHHHFFYEATGRLRISRATKIEVTNLPHPPHGAIRASYVIPRESGS